VVNLLAFFAVYTADGGHLAWGEFLTANFNRPLWIHDAFITGFSSRPALFFAILAGLVLCLLSAVVRAPYFRAIAGPGYPLAPRSWAETAQLTLYYLFSNVLLGVLPLAAPANNALALVILAASLVVNVLIAFADYAIVFERLSFVAGVRRSVRLVSQNALPLVFVVAAYWFVTIVLHQLYGLYYNGTSRVFFLLPVSQILIEGFLVLMVDLVLIFLYQKALIRSTQGAGTGT
jgi:hypothetical protein